MVASDWGCRLGVDSILCAAIRLDRCDRELGLSRGSSTDSDRRVCNTFAMLRFADDHNGLATLLFIFNLLTSFAAVSATTIGAMRLTGLVD
jgi:hypothetical protein